MTLKRSSQSVCEKSTNFLGRFFVIDHKLAHNDLGILSLVLSDAPGLHCMSRRNGLWYNAEALATSKSSTASLLSGREMEHFTNRKYRPGAHSVIAPAPETLDATQKYRYSLVFI